MRGWAYLIFFLVIFLGEGSLLGKRIRPFGYKSPRIPEGATHIEILDDKIEFRARQVCGYTDWASSSILLPKQLLSLEHWKKVGGNLKSQAKQTLIAITGALPAMLIANASPTFAAVLNRAEAMAQANLRFTFDTCQMLEGMNDSGKAHFGPLAGCVQKKMKDGGYTQSQAIDACTVGSRIEENSAEKALKKAAEGSKNRYDKSSLDDFLCEKSERSGLRSHQKDYSISTLSCKWGKEVFPGFKIDGGVKLMHGGTFSNAPAEEKYDVVIKNSEEKLSHILTVMHSLRFAKGRYAQKGARSRKEILQHPDVKKAFGMDKNSRILGLCYKDDKNCKQDMGKLPPFYKFSGPTTLPSLMVTPEMLYEVVRLIPKEEKPSELLKDEGSALSQAIEPLVQSLAYTRTQDILKDTALRLVRSCNHPKFQSVEAQEDCKGRLAILDREQENLRIRNEADQKHLEAQARYYAAAAAMREKGKPEPTSRAISQPFQAPWEVR